MGWTQANSTDLVDLMNMVSDDEETKKRETRTRAQAYAQVCHSMGCKPGDMTDAQRALAEAHLRRMFGGTSGRRGTANSVPGGFRISAEGRRPQR